MAGSLAASPGEVLGCLSGVDGVRIGRCNCPADGVDEAGSVCFELEA